MKKRIPYFFSGVLLVAVALSSCKKKEPTSWNVDAVAPLVKSSLTIADVIPDSLLEVQNDNSIHLVYDDPIFTLRLDTLIDIPDTSITESFSLPFGNFGFEAGETIYQMSDDNTFGVSGAQLTDLIVREGDIVFTLSSTINQPHEVQYTITNSAEYDNGTYGAPFSVTVQMPAGSIANPATLTSSFPIDGYYIQMSGSQNNSYNKLETDLVISNSLTSDSAFLGTGDEAIVDITFTNMVPQYAKGYFGSQSFDMDPETTTLDVFDRIISGSLDIDMIDIELDLINGIGIDAEATIQTLSVSNTNSGITNTLNHSIINNPIHLNRAQENWGVVTPGIWSTALDNQNSNIDVLIETLPHTATYDMDLNINPQGNISGGTDFFHYDHPFEVWMRAEMPLCLIANDLTLQDTVRYDLYQDSIPGRFNYGKFYVFAENSFPLSASLQVYILQNGAIVDSVVTDQLILGADEGGPAQISRLVLDLTPAQVDMLYGENVALILQTVLNTTNAAQPGSHLKIYDHHRMDLQLTGDFGYTIELE